MDEPSIRFQSEREPISCETNDSGEGMDFRQAEVCKEEKDILAKFEPYVTGEYLVLCEEEENPIWGWILQDVGLDSKANDVIQSNEELLEFLRPFFTAALIERIAAALIYSTSSSFGETGPSYLRRGSYAWFVERLIEQIADEMSHVAEDNDEAESSVAEGIRAVTGESAAKRQKLSVPVTQGRQSLSSVGSDDDPTGRKYFQNVVVRKVVVGENAGTIVEQSRRFCAKVIEVYGELPAPVYRPEATICGKNPHVYVFHGTRVKRMRTLKNMGIYPRPHRSDFARGATFYVSNSLQYSYERVLLDVLPNASKDGVAIYVFLVPVWELLGVVPTSDGEKFDVNSFPTRTKEWAAFLKHNWSVRGTIYPPPPRTDITFGPIGGGEWSEAFTEEASVTHYDPLSPIQLSLRTEKSRRWLERHLQFCYEEVRH